MRHVFHIFVFSGSMECRLKIAALLPPMIILLIGCGDGFDDSGVEPPMELPSSHKCKDNHPPLINDLPDTFVVVGGSIHLTATATDQDDDDFTFHCDCTNVTWGDIKSGNLPQYSIGPYTGEFHFTANGYDAPYRKFSVAVRDDCDYSSISFTVEVIDDGCVPSEGDRRESISGMNSGSRKHLDLADPYRPHSYASPRAAQLYSN